MHLDHDAGVVERDGGPDPRVVLERPPRLPPVHLVVDQPAHGVVERAAGRLVLVDLHDDVVVVHRDVRCHAGAVPDALFPDDRRFVQVADAVVERVGFLGAVHLDHPAEPGDGDRRRLAVVVLEPEPVEDRIDVRVNAHTRRRVWGRLFGQNGNIPAPLSKGFAWHNHGLMDWAAPLDESDER